MTPVGAAYGAALVRPRAGDRRVRHGGYPLMSETEKARRNQVRDKRVGYGPYIRVCRGRSTSNERP